MNNQALGRSAALVLAMSLAACSGAAASGGMSEEGRLYVIDACVDVFEKDWEQTSIESMSPYRNEFIEIRNRSVDMDDETRRVVGELAEQASELTELYNQWLRDMPTRVLQNLDEVVAATDKFRAGQSEVAAEINRICAPFFE